MKSLRVATKLLPFRCYLILVFACCPIVASAATFTSFEAFQAAAGPLTTDDFESGPWALGSVMQQPTVNLGVSWTALEQLFVSSGHRSGAHSITDNDQLNTNRDQLFAVMPLNIQAVGGWLIGTASNTTATLFAYDADNNVLE